MPDDFSVLFWPGTPPESLDAWVARSVGKPVVAWDLRLVDAQPPAAVGDFIASHRLDNLGSTFSGLKALVSSEPSDSLNVLVAFDHEEIGSGTAEGAHGDFLRSVLTRIVGEEQLPVVIAKSYGISCDAAQGYHPNWPGKYDPAHAPKLGAGVSLKRSPGYLYATDLTACRPIQKACAKLGIQLQCMMNRNDLRGGSTIGPPLSATLGLVTADMGQPLLAMHSIRELVAMKDVDDTTTLFKELYTHFDEYRPLLQ
jgi:aspartyl aminopeptidase